MLTKRDRERQKQEAKKRKAEKKAARQSNQPRSQVADGVDPDIAHIVAGPQPLPDEAAALDTDVYPIDTAIGNDGAIKADGKKKGS